MKFLWICCPRLCFPPSLFVTEVFSIKSRSVKVLRRNDSKLIWCSFEEEKTANYVCLVVRGSICRWRCFYLIGKFCQFWIPENFETTFQEFQLDWIYDRPLIHSRHRHDKVSIHLLGSYATNFNKFIRRLRLYLMNVDQVILQEISNKNFLSSLLSCNFSIC